VICWNTTGSPATNGSTGCAAGTLYSGSPLTVSASETIYAVAGGAGYTDSSVASASYSISPACANTALGSGWTCVSDAAAWTGSSVTSFPAGAFPANPSTGSLIVVFQFNGGSAACSAPTDTLGNSAVAISSGTFSGGTMCDYYLIVAAGGADTVTCNAGGAATQLGCDAVNVSGNATSSPLDQTCTASGGTTGSGSDNMVCSAPITPGENNELVVAWSVTSVAAGVSAGTNFTMIDAGNQNGEYYRQSTSATITPAQTAATSGVGYGFVAASFKPPGTMMAGPAAPTGLTSVVR
jgi:hypothetical protein